MTGALSAIGFSSQHSDHPELIISLPFIILFIDYYCTLAVSPWVYSALYFENKIFLNSHNIVKNWNKSFGVPVELASESNNHEQMERFKKSYLINTFKRKTLGYLILTSIVLALYFEVF